MNYIYICVCVSPSTRFFGSTLTNAGGRGLIPDKRANIQENGLYIFIYTSNNTLLPNYYAELST